MTQMAPYPTYKKRYKLETLNNAGAWEQNKIDELEVAHIMQKEAWLSMHKSLSYSIKASHKSFPWTCDTYVYKS